MTTPASPATEAGHTFGHHPDDRDPWDALLLDVQALEGGFGPYASLVSFWRTEARSVPTRPEPLTVERLAAAVIEQWDENTSSDWFRDTSLRDIDRGVERMRERIEALRAALATPSEGEAS